MQGSIQLLSSLENEFDRRLKVTACNVQVPNNICHQQPEKPGDTMDIPLPGGVDWKVVTENHESHNMELVKLAFECSNTNRKIKIQIGLPYTDEESLHKAKMFAQSLIDANAKGRAVASVEPQTRNRRKMSRSISVV